MELQGTLHSTEAQQSPCASKTRATLLGQHPLLELALLLISSGECLYLDETDTAVSVHSPNNLSYIKLNKLKKYFIVQKMCILG